MIKYSDFKENTWNGTPRVLIASGDPYQSTEVIRKARSFLETQHNDLISDKFSSPDNPLSSALETFKILGLFGETRCVEYSTDKELSSKEESNIPYTEQSGLLEIAESLDSGNYLLIKIPTMRSSNWLKQIKEKFYFVDCSIPKLNRSQLKTWIISLGKDRNLNINDEGAYALIERILGASIIDTKSTAQIEKSLILMELSSDSKNLWNREKIQNFFTAELQNNIFDLTDALATLNLKKSLHLVDWFYSRGTKAVELIGGLRMQFRKLLLLKELHSKKSEEEVMRELKLPSFVYRKTLEQANKFNLQKLKKIYTELYNLDKSLKSVSINEKDLFEMFILKIFFAS